jgi:hypothetical protein
VDERGVELSGGGVTKSMTGVTVLGTIRVVLTVVVQSALAPYKKGSNNKRVPLIVAMFRRIESMMRLH